MDSVQLRIQKSYYIQVGNHMFQCILYKTHPICNAGHTVGGLSSQMLLENWEYELSFENNNGLRDYLHNGISRGFDIVDRGVYIAPYNCRNYNSVLKEPGFSTIDCLITQELAEGKYIVAKEVPICIHALGLSQEVFGGLQAYYGLP